MEKRGKIVILGCGRVGIALTQMLVHAGYEVTVIDKNRQAFERLPRHLPVEEVVGLGIDQEVLERAGIKEAQGFIAVSGGDNSNVMAAQIAQRVYRVPKVLARIKDPLRAQAYRDMGLQVFCTPIVDAGIFFDALHDRPFSKVEDYLPTPSYLLEDYMKEVE